jgi:hypothetical protein
MAAASVTYERGCWTISYTFSDGPLSGQTLTQGRPATHPTAGEGVKFSNHFVRIEGRPELAVAVAELRENEKPKCRPETAEGRQCRTNYEESFSE